MILQGSLGGEVDTQRLGLWGTSYAGGHVLVMAAKEGANVSAVVSMVRTPCKIPCACMHAVWRARQPWSGFISTPCCLCLCPSLLRHPGSLLSCQEERMHGYSTGGSPE